MLPLPLPPYSVQNINFVGSIVRVVMTDITGSTTQMANIYFDDCGCTGTFPPPDGYGAGLETSADNPWNASPLNLTNITPTGFANGGFSVITGSSTFLAPYTGLYNLVVTDFFVSVHNTHPIGGNDIDYTVTLNTSGLERTWSGNKTGLVCCNVVTNLFRETSFDMGNIFLQAGEEVVWYIDYSLTDNTGDHFEGDTELLIYILCSVVTL